MYGYNNKRSNILGYDQDTSSNISSGNESFAIGTICAFYGYLAPVNWLLCDGSTFEIITYPELYTLLDTNVLPDLRNQVLKGISDSRQIGSLEQDSIGTHNHTFTATSQAGGAVQATINTYNFIQPVSLTTSESGTHVHSIQYDDGNGSSGIAHESGNSRDGRYNTDAGGNHVHTVSGDITITIPQQVSQTLPTHTHLVSGTTNNTGTETKVKNFAVNFIIKAKLTSSNVSNTVTQIGDRITKGTGMLVQTETQVIANKELNMGSQRITSLATPNGLTDAVNVSYLNQQTSSLQNAYIVADTVVSNAYIAADVVLDNKIESLKNKLVDNVGNNITMQNGVISHSGLQVCDYTGAQVNCATDITLNNNAVNVSTLKSYKQAYLETGSGSSIDRAGFVTTNNFDITIDTVNKFNLNANDITLNVPFNTLVQYDSIPYTSVTNPQTLVHKTYVDNMITNALNNLVLQKYVRFQSFDDSVWNYRQHDLFNQGNAYILKPGSDCFVQAFNAYVPISLINSSGNQFMRCTQLGIYKIDINMSVRVGINQSSLSFTTWLQNHMFGRHLQNGIPNNGADPHRYSSLVSCFVNASGQALIKGHKSIFELCNGILATRSGTNNDLYGGSYDQMMYHVHFSGMVQLFENVNYFVCGPVLFNSDITEAQVISNVYDCSVDIQLLE